MVRLDKAIADLMDQFILVRIIGMRGVDLNRFDFDFDQELAILFQTPAGHTYGRFHAPSADTAERYLTMPALRYALEGALRHYRTLSDDPPAQAEKPRLVEHYPAAARLRASACIHCHQVHEFRRQADQTAGRWKKDDVWSYPLPENLGVTVDVVRSNVVQSVREDMPAHRLGMRVGDTICAIAGRPVRTIADLQYALQHAPARGQVAIAWERRGQPMAGKLELADGWRRSDVSWRGSLKSLGPSPLVDGEDLTAAEKQALGLAADRLAFRQHPFPPAEARQAGLRPGDIIIGLAGRQPAATARQFRLHIQLNHEAGDAVTINILRAGQPVDVFLTLPRR